MILKNNLILDKITKSINKIEYLPPGEVESPFPP